MKAERHEINFCYLTLFCESLKTKKQINLIIMKNDDISKIPHVQCTCNHFLINYRFEFSQFGLEYF